MQNYLNVTITEPQEKLLDPPTLSVSPPAPPGPSSCPVSILGLSLLVDADTRHVRVCSLQKVLEYYTQVLKTRLEIQYLSQQ